MVSRQKYLDDLDRFLENCQTNVTNMLDTLGWTPDHFIQPKKVARCQYNSNHTMTPAALEKHEPICELIQQECSKEEAEKILDNSDYFYEGASCVYKVKIDKETLNSVLWNYHVKNHSVYYGHGTMPLTPDQEEQMLSREDRLGLGEYVVAKAREANRLAQLEKDELMASANLADLIKTDDGGKRQLDPIEEMAALRDYRRRRQSYRAKNVHITKKSHTEIMREVINNQMEMYSKQLQDEAESGSAVQDRVNKMLESVKEEVEDGEYREPSHSTHDHGGQSSRELVRNYNDTRERSKDRDGGYSRERSRARDRSRERSREKDSRHSDRHYDDGDREKKEDRDRSRSRHKHKRSRSRSRSRTSHRSKSHKKHKKHKHKSHHKDRDESPASISANDNDSVTAD